MISKDTMTSSKLQPRDADWKGFDLAEELRKAYARGRADTLAALGLDEADLPQGDGAQAWAG
ncbi:hypothetical protein [Oceanomicrobium pacificus]|uniref:Uncharacterized protein n=1 Tax=Oceanomicrobium pacificus TaxID=2692916 RepID=A0A6B0U0P2_9RHOB|nr:hypothetical protein [Oceanomicrobium pacificus]MXU66774.1 hypothetical protein [Oceanomicrobium pacificus]